MTEPSGESGPTCVRPESFTYGMGVARFCPSSESVVARTSGDDFAPMVNHPVSMGIATFSNWEPGIPDAVLGLAGNLEGANRSGLSPTIQQVNPAHLSFRFPNGGLANGTMPFDELPDQPTGGGPRIPLVSPGGLGYGYTANVRRMEFLEQGTIASSIVFEPGGVYLENGSTRDRIADRHLAFFDTGTPLPIVFSNGDVSLLGDNVTAGDIGTRTTGRRYDQVRVVFDDSSGDTVTISTSNLAPFANNNPSALVPTKAEFPAGMKLPATVVGYPILSEYDVQIDFDNGAAKTIRFSSR